ncbi:DNA-binding protein [Methylorubrum populi]
MTNSVEEVRQRFEAEGISIAEWARTNGFNERTVYAVLRGELHARRGVSHRIAVALGLKQKPQGSLQCTRAA